MDTLKEQKIQAMVETEIGFQQKDYDKAGKGLDKFLEIAMLEMNLEDTMDRAEAEDRYYQYDDNED
jgi:hypothetical protein